MDIAKNHPPVFKAKVAMEAIKEAETTGQLASKYSVHPIQIGLWKKIAKEAIEKAFSQKGQKSEKNKQDLLEELFQKIGRLDMENDFLKKKVGLLE